MTRGVARNLLSGDKTGGLGDRNPLAGSRGRAPVEVWGEAPEAEDTLISSYDGDMHPAPGYPYPIEINVHVIVYLQSL